MNNRSNSSLERDDEPPPLPPPRGESLTRSMMADLSPDTPTENGTFIPFKIVFALYVKTFFILIADELNGPPDKPLPSEPPNHTESSTGTKSIANNISDQNVDDIALPDEVTLDDTSNSSNLDG